ncbi:hypothetical protein [Paenibacillus sp. R14(2021)]|uniref:CTP synthase C-terminal region-related (seleno)protein n=1 Tax=Paenibacillus sp. R14(2021) TaxID=2859228 RepID=UPI001C616563|nr:hypothetical protein [Paenibacillus sp. R14(2021)]
MKIGIVGDYHPGYPSQQATQEALEHSARKLDADLDYAWLPTTEIPEHPASAAAAYDGFWIAPGSPESPEGVMRMIRYARENGVPLLGTCGGFQQMILEYARHELLLADARHEELDPAADVPLISKLACSLVGQEGEIVMAPSSRIAAIFGILRTVEPFRCNYGLNPAYQALIEASDLRIAGTDAQGNPRVVELPGHPFYIGTLFVPQLRSTPEQPHGLVDAFVASAGRQRGFAREYEISG